MRQEDKELLLKDLCARLPYMPKIKIIYQQQGIKGTDEGNVSCDFIEKIVNDLRNGIITDMQIYLRPMSSMNEEEKKDLLNTILGDDAKLFHIDENGNIQSDTPEITTIDKFQLCYINFDCDNAANYIDWLNKHHFDFRNLIERGLAIEATEEDNPYK